MRQRKRLSHDFVLVLIQPESTGSSKLLCLPPIIRGVLCGVYTRILKIRCFLAEIEAKQNHTRAVFAVSPFIFKAIYIFIYKQTVILIKKRKEKSPRMNSSDPSIISPPYYYLYKNCTFHSVAFVYLRIAHWCMKL